MGWYDYGDASTVGFAAQAYEKAEREQLSTVDKSPIS